MPSVVFFLLLLLFSGEEDFLGFYYNMGMEAIAVCHMFEYVYFDILYVCLFTCML